MWWALVAGTVALGAALWGPVASQVEQAKYEVVAAYGAIETRDYAPMIVAETTVAGERESAINDGFRRIADYIFGNNTGAQSVAMTAPVTQGASEPVAMTAPVTQQEKEGEWMVRFVMPAQYSMETLPKPKNSAVRLRSVESKRFAVIRFSGSTGTAHLKEQEAKLVAWMSEQNLSAAGAPVYAFFNPPWTLPFLRRNEVMIEIAAAK